jgi:hypothetical protein
MEMAHRMTTVASSDSAPANNRRMGRASGASRSPQARCRWGELFEVSMSRSGAKGPRPLTRSVRPAHAQCRLTINSAES